MLRAPLLKLSSFGRVDPSTGRTSKNDESTSHRLGTLFPFFQGSEHGRRSAKRSASRRWGPDTSLPALEPGEDSWHLAFGFGLEPKYEAPARKADRPYAGSAGKPPEAQARVCSWVAMPWTCASLQTMPTVRKRLQLPLQLPLHPCVPLHCSLTVPLSWVAAQLGQLRIQTSSASKHCCKRKFSREIFMPFSEA